MFRFIVSLILWFSFLGICVIAIKFGLYIGNIEISWNDALWYAMVVRVLFYVNEGYSYIKKDLDL